MIAPNRPDNEAERLETLCSLDVLDTPPEERFDRVTRLAQRLFGVPIVLVSLIDENRQWFKSRQGLEATETPRDISFCGHAILSEAPLVVPDATLDSRFSDNPLVSGDPRIRFYAGYPLAAKNGCRLGTLCLIDPQPRVIGQEDIQLLGDLAAMVEDELRALELATMDELTGLSNRRGFEALANQSLSVCRRLEKKASILFFDLDGFKEINDGFGHKVGDRVLVEFADVLAHTFRDCDVVARLGGDEFCVLLTNAQKEESASPLARLAQGVTERNRFHHDYSIRYSVGEVSYDPERHQSLADLVDDADRHMYCAKRRQELVATAASSDVS